MAQKVGLKINANKTKVMTTGCGEKSSIRVQGQAVENFQQFVNLGSIVDQQGGTDADVKSRINKARRAFASLKPIWNSSKISRRTKLRLFNSNVKSVQLYGSEAWKISQEIAKKVRVFIHKCLRIILHVRWPRKIFNADRG